MKTVRFADDVEGVGHDTIQKTIDTLRKAGVIVAHNERASDMIGISRDKV